MQIILLSLSYAVMSHVSWIIQAGNHWLGCLSGASRRANAVWQHVFGSPLHERRCFRRLEVSRGHQARAVSSVALTRPEKHLPPRRSHVYALFPIGDGAVLGHPRRAVARRRSTPQGRPAVALPLSDNFQMLLLTSN
jgi:hypothetical protein